MQCSSCNMSNPRFLVVVLMMELPFRACMCSHHREPSVCYSLQYSGVDHRSDGGSCHAAAVCQFGPLPPSSQHGGTCEVAIESDR